MKKLKKKNKKNEFTLEITSLEGGNSNIRVRCDVFRYYPGKHNVNNVISYL